MLPAVPAGTKEVPGDSSNPEPRMPLPSATAVSKPTEQSPVEQKEGDDAIQSQNPESLRLADERAGLLKFDQHVARVQAPAEVPTPMPHGPRFLALPKEEQVMLKRAHQNLCHPSPDKLSAVLRAQ